MKPKKILCHCGGKTACLLCHGQKTYDYTPGPRGTMPFRCPTCEGKGTLLLNGTNEPCFTCVGTGTVDPGNPPVPSGGLDMLWKTLFGA